MKNVLTKIVSKVNSTRKTRYKISVYHHTVPDGGAFVDFCRTGILCRGAYGCPYDGNDGAEAMQIIRALL